MVRRVLLYQAPWRDAREFGGLFFDELNEWGSERCFEFTKSVGVGFVDAYLPIVQKHTARPYGNKEKNFQLIRRGRYVEFNLMYDRGSLFGLQSQGRVESILMSLPPAVSWVYNWQPEKGSPEEALCDYLKPREWLTLA